MKRPAIFFDRDNTLIAADGYLGDPSDVRLVSGAAAAVARARRLGYATVVVSNQSGVARGLFDEAAVHAVNQRLEQLLLADDPASVIDRHEFCPYHPQAEVATYRRDSDLRKPRPGMIRQAAEMLALDLRRSWVIGDSPRDIEAGHAAGCRTILFDDPSLPRSPAADEPVNIEPDYRAATLADAMAIVERHADLPDLNQDDRDAPTISNSNVESSIASALIGGAGVGPAKPRAPRVDAKPSEIAPDAAKSRSDERVGRSDERVGVVGSPPAERPRSSGTEAAQVSRANPFRSSARAQSGVAEARPEPPRIVAKPPIVIELPRPPAAEPQLPEKQTADKSSTGKATPTAPNLARIEATLDQILHELRRRDEDDDFSVSKLLAGIVQVLAVGLVFVAYLNREGDNFYPLILFSLFVQMLVVALLIMGRQR